tara:strand:+ start:30 stop:620 length:591 start_codon:yes stop_codon:yes gene_type:complete
MSYNAKVQLTSNEGMAIYADSSPAPMPDLNGRDGWLFKKTSGAEKFNYYYWAEGSRALTLADIQSHYIVASVDTYTNIQSVPFIVIYTKPTGVGDAGAFYHSKIAYTISRSEIVNLGEIVQYYTHLSRPFTINGYRQVPLSIEIKTGDALPTEEILYMTIHSDSAAADNCSILVSRAGYITRHTTPQFLNLELNSN